MTTVDDFSKLGSIMNKEALLSTMPKEPEAVLFEVTDAKSAAEYLDLLTSNAVPFDSGLYHQAKALVNSLA